MTAGCTFFLSSDCFAEGSFLFVDQPRGAAEAIIRKKSKEDILMKKKLCSILLALTMVLTLLPVSALAEDGAEKVAKIGDTEYTTLQDAINAAGDAGSETTITLLTNVDLTNATIKQLRFTKANSNIVLDLAGNTVTAADDEAIMLNEANITLTIKNGTITNNIPGSYSDGLYAYAKCNNLSLTLDNVTINSRTQGLAVQGLTSNSNVTVKNSVITSTEELGIYYPPKSGTLSIENSQITGVTGIVVKGSTLNVSGDKTVITGFGPKIDPEEYYTGATDGSSTLTETGDAIYVESGYNDRDISVNISGGQLVSTNAKSIQMFIKNSEVTSVKRDVSVSGGTFSDLSALNYLAPSANVSVKLTADTQKDVVIPANTTVTLDLNGHNLTNVSGHTITNNGNLTVTGSGTVDNISDGKGALVNKVGAIATLNGGTFTRSQEAGTYEPDLANGNSWYTVKNYGTMTINAGATVTTRLTDDNGNAVGGHSSLIANGWQNANDLTNNPRNDNQNALLTVNGGTFIGGINTVKNDDYSELVFNNGTCTNYTQAAFQNHNIATINGGSFVAESHWSIYNCPCNANSDKGELTITGGSFTGNIAHVKADYGFIKISGGTYSVNPTAYVADTHIVRKDGDAQFTVVAKSNLTSGVYLTDPSGALASNYYVSSTANGVWTVSYSAPYSGGSSSYDPTYSVSTPSKTENGSVTVSPKSASKGDTVTVTVKPNEGYVLETLTVTDKNGDELKLTDKGNGKYTFTMPGSKVEVKATFMEDNSVFNFFYDVPNDAFFYEAVKWAVKSGVTNGLSDTMFGPYESCTRAQIVTFLWRAAGSPEPKTASSFADVPASAYYAKAVAWAVENGITNGMTETTFAPDATCTRGQSVTFLYRALKGTASGSTNFTDVASDAFYADAINWAVANNVTNGTSATTFSPNADCTRAEIVTFLYRAYQGK